MGLGESRSQGQSQVQSSGGNRGGLGAGYESLPSDKSAKMCVCVCVG